MFLKIILGVIRAQRGSPTVRTPQEKNIIFQDWVDLRKTALAINGFRSLSHFFSLLTTFSLSFEGLFIYQLFKFFFKLTYYKVCSEKSTKIKQLCNFTKRNRRFNIFVCANLLVFLFNR